MTANTMTAPHPTGLSVRPLTGQWGRLGVALHFVARQEPFASFRSADLVSTLSAQIQREHCLFALDGERVVGYLGWAEYDAAVARRFAAGGAPPPNTLARGKDVVWILTAAATHDAALMALVRTLRSEHAGMRVMGIRHKPEGRRVVFDRAAREQAVGRRHQVQIDNSSMSKLPSSSNTKGPQATSSVSR
jgi:hypothetical protein